jgi:cellulose synthase operon protein C
MFNALTGYEKMGINDFQIPPPKNWEKFEDLCLDIFREQWGDLYATKNGRKGQAQHGTDIYGSPKQYQGQIHGVQCKGKDILYGGIVTEKELESEVAKALKFEPALDHWLLVTTAAKDKNIELIARRITARHAKQGLFPVKIFGWEDLINLIADSDVVMDKHYPGQGPSQKKLLDSMDSQQAGLKAIAVMVTESQAFQTEERAFHSLMIDMMKQSSTAPVDASEVTLQARLNDLCFFIQEHQPKTALKYVERLIEEYWNTVLSPYTRFRLLVNKAIILVNLGHSEEGARTFIEAFSFAPNDPKAIICAAQGHFILGNIEESRRMLDGLLVQQPENNDALTLRIAVSVEEEAVKDPFLIVQNQDTVNWKVCMSAGRWYYDRGSLNDAMAMFKRALMMQPNRLDVMAEVAAYTLKDLFKIEVNILVHHMDTEQRTEFLWAVDLLDRVWDTVKSTEVHNFFLWIPYNLCIAQRYLSNLDKAYERVDEGLSFAPDNCDLLYQKSLIEAAMGKHEELLKTLDRRNANDPEVCVMRSHALMEMGRHSEASAVLDKFPDNSTQRLQIEAVRLRVRLLVMQRREEEAFQVAKDIAIVFPKNITARILISDLLMYSGNMHEALHEARDAAVLLKNDANNGDIECLAVANALYRLEVWDEVADLLTTAGNPQFDNDLLRLRVDALLYANRRQELRELLDSLSAEIASKPHYVFISAQLFCISGDYLSAKTDLETYLRQVPDDLNAQRLLVDVVENMDNSSTLTP